jgi:T5SS/PEP-CTERM-associated repeat protein
MVENVAGYIGQYGNSTNNSVTVNGAGSEWKVSSWLRVGVAGSGNFLSITNGGRVQSASGGIGFESSSFENTVEVSGTDSIWNTTDSINVGARGRGNVLNITEGGRARSTFGNIGRFASASGNRVLIDGAGSLWECSTNLYVGGNQDGGTGGSGNSLAISNGGRVASSHGYIGLVNNASNNIVTVSGTGSVWTNSAQLRIGLWGAGNVLSIHSGGHVDCTFGSIGGWSDSVSNKVLVSDSGSVWNIDTALNVATHGNHSSLIITNGGKVLSNAGYIGVGVSSSNNTAIICDAGSTWSQGTGGFRVSRDGCGNSLIITNGGSVLNGAWASIGHLSPSSNNHAIVTGSGSVWSTGTSLEVGNNGSGNTLLISDGGRVENGTFGRVGDELNSSNNSVIVTGSNSTWEATGAIVVGRLGIGNLLTIKDGAHVHNDFGTIGGLTNSTHNSATVSGKGSVWINTRWLTVANDGSHSSLIITNGGWVQNSNGNIGSDRGSSNSTVFVSDVGSKWDCFKTLNVGGSASGGAGGTGNSITVSNGAIISTPLLNIFPSNTFNLQQGGRLETGAVNGDLDVHGTFAPGNSMTNATMSGDLLLGTGGTLEMEIGGFAQDTDYDHLSITGLTVLAGTLDVVFTNGFAPAFGTFDLFDYVDGLSGTFDTIKLPPLSFGQKWNTSQLYTAGEIRIDYVTADSDGDGIEDGWEGQYFGGDISPTNNADSDPFNNYQEFIAGTIPTNGASHFAVNCTTSTNSEFIIDWVSVSGRVYNVYWTTNLTDSFQPLETGIGFPRNSCTDTVHNAEDHCFYRVNVQLVDSHPLSQIHYVDINNTTPAPPYSSWQTAATNIQDAVDVAIDDNTVLVADGLYFLTSEITVTNAIAVQSVNGPDVTIIDGGGSNRCFNLYSNICAVSGFTVTHGYHDELSYSGGGGIFCNFSRLPIISDCIIVGNRASKGGGLAGGTAINCTIISNTAPRGGGVVGSRLENCLISGNSSEQMAGGIYVGTARNCVVSNNVAGSDGGGMYQGLATNCLIVGNTAGNDGGGAHYSTLINCTVSDNLATNNGGGMSAGTGLDYGVAINSIIYYNTALNSGNDWDGNGSMVYCCSTADWAHVAAGCITNEPGYINRDMGNYRLATKAPCISAGWNDFAPALPDLDGQPRIVDFVVDMGAYESQIILDSDGDQMSDGYEMIYFGNKTNSIAGDNPDFDPHNNLEEFIAGTDPTAGAAYFCFTNAIPDATGFIVEWAPSISNRLYNIQWSTNLTTGYHPLETGINYPQNSCTDTVHSTEDQCFYTVDVQLK